MLPLYLFAQEDSTEASSNGDQCNRTILTTPYHVVAKIRATDLDQRVISFTISWTHIPAMADTFQIVHSTNHDILEYVSAKELRTLKSRPARSFRAMATHHLRERIFGSTLRFDDLELLARGAFQCQDSLSKSRTKLKTAFSSTWYTLAWDSLQPPSTFVMYGLRKARRSGVMNDWKALPGKVRLEETPALWADISIEEQEFRMEQDFEFWKPWSTQNW
jgi:hypothetical protein